jgi:hypothetical protein
VGIIVPFLRDGVGLHNKGFMSLDIHAMFKALSDACQILDLQDDYSAKRALAARIVDLALDGERNPSRLVDTVLHEAGLTEYVGVSNPVPLTPVLVRATKGAPRRSASKRQALTVAGASTKAAATGTATTGWNGN